MFLKRDTLKDWLVLLIPPVISSFLFLSLLLPLLPLPILLGIGAFISLGFFSTFIASQFLTFRSIHYLLRLQHLVKKYIPFFQGVPGLTEQKPPFSSSCGKITLNTCYFYLFVLGVEVWLIEYVFDLFLAQTFVINSLLGLWIGLFFLIFILPPLFYLFLILESVGIILYEKKPLVCKNFGSYLKGKITLPAFLSLIIFIAKNVYTGKMGEVGIIIVYVLLFLMFLPSAYIPIAGYFLFFEKNRVEKIRKKLKEKTKKRHTTLSLYLFD